MGAVACCAEPSKAFLTKQGKKDKNDLPPPNMSIVRRKIVTTT